MPSEATVDLAGLNRKLLDFSVVMKRTVPVVLKQQGRLAVTELTKFTPPTGKEPISESFADQRKAGNRAVDRDVHRAFMQVDELKIAKADDAMGREVRDYIARGEIQSLSKVLQAIGIHGQIIMQPTTDIHNSKRDRRGRVSKSTKGFLVMTPGSVAKFSRVKQKLVGTAKSGFGKAAAALNAIIPQWAKRGTGEYVDQSHATDKPYILIGNNVGYIQSTAAGLGVVRRVVERRKQSMQHQMEAVLHQGFSGYHK